MASFDIAELTQSLHAVRREWREAHGRSHEPGAREFPSREALSTIIEQLKGALFPMRLGPHDLRQESEDIFVAHQLDTALHALLGQIRLELRLGGAHSALSSDAMALDIARAFAETLPHIRRMLDSDVLAAFHGDPAARSVDEVLLCYPGVLAMINHRLAHQLYLLGQPLLARIVAELSHAQTGIDIHPGARIGRGFFMDHGTGIVIGETAVIGERVRLYQAVTLGAKRFPTDEQGHLRKGLARHPVVEDDVVIYAGATILGRVTLGRGAVIGGNVWVTHDVPPGAHVTQAHAREQARSAPEVTA